MLGDGNLRTLAGSAFQTVAAVQRKAQFESSVLLQVTNPNIELCQ